jgi:hypothetical protein
MFCLFMKLFLSFRGDPGFGQISYHGLLVW